MGSRWSGGAMRGIRVFGCSTSEEVVIIPTGSEVSLGSKVALTISELLESTGEIAGREEEGSITLRNSVDIEPYPFIRRSIGILAL